MISERARKIMYESMERIHGKEVADTVMGHLPPVGWADVATKQDLDALRAATKQDLASLEARIEVLLHREMISQTKWFMGATIGAVIAVSGLPQVLGAVFTGG